MLAMPRIGGMENMWMNGAYEAFCILIICPLIVAIGAGSDIKGKKSVGCLHLPRRNLISSLYHTFPSGLHADCLGKQSPGCSTRYGYLP